MTEAQIQADILKHIADRQGDGEPLRAWRNNTGGAVPLAALPALLQQAAKGVPIGAILASARVMKFGVAGQADVSGLVGPDGRRLEIEVKKPGGRQSDAQRNFQRMVAAMGGLYVLARSADDVARALDAAAAARRTA